MIFLQKYGFYFLLLGVISDLSTPYISFFLSQTESNDYRN